jgi:hypothetical protein
MSIVRSRLSVAVLGLGILAAGLTYDVLFAGIPYPDPTPETQAAWSFHSRVAGWIETTGVLVFLFGLLIAPVMGRSDR